MIAQHLAPFEHGLQPPTLAKRIATARAIAALQAAQLVDIETDDGGLAWLLTCGPMTRRFDRDQLDELEATIQAMAAQ